MASLMIVLGIAVVLGHSLRLVNWRNAASRTRTTLDRAQSAVPAQVKQRWAESESAAACYRMVSGGPGYGIDRPTLHLVRVS